MKYILVIFNFLATVCLFNTAQAHDSKLLKNGEKLYLANCARCHGIDGDGTGKDAKHLSPPPANLLESLQKQVISDEYLIWTIREGGRNIHTAMPSFETEGQLDENDAKAIIRYLRATFQ